MIIVKVNLIEGFSLNEVKVFYYYKNCVAVLRDSVLLEDGTERGSFATYDVSATRNLHSLLPGL